MTQQQLNERFNSEFIQSLDRVVFEWNEDVRKWHEWATKAAECNATPANTNWSSDRWDELYLEPEGGLNMNVVGVLCDCLATTSQGDLKLDRVTYTNIIKENWKIIKLWHKKADPIADMIRKRLQIMNIQNTNLNKNLNSIPKA